MIDQLKKTSNSTGPDGGQFDYVDVFTQSHAYRCYFSKFLDNGDNELGHDCHQTVWKKFIYLLWNFIFDEIKANKNHWILYDFLV